MSVWGWAVTVWCIASFPFGVLVGKSLAERDAPCECGHDVDAHNLRRVYAACGVCRCRGYVRAVLTPVAPVVGGREQPALTLVAGSASPPVAASRRSRPSSTK